MGAIGTVATGFLPVARVGICDDGDTYLAGSHLMFCFGDIGTTGFGDSVAYFSPAATSES